MPIVSQTNRKEITLKSKTCGKYSYIGT